MTLCRRCKGRAIRHPMRILSSKPLGKTEPYLALTACNQLQTTTRDSIFAVPYASPHFKKMPAIVQGMGSGRYPLYSGIIKGKNSWLGLSKTLSNVKSPALRDILPEFEKEFEWVFKKLKPLESPERQRDASSGYQKLSTNFFQALISLDTDTDTDCKEQASEFLERAVPHRQSHAYRCRQRRFAGNSLTASRYILNRFRERGGRRRRAGLRFL